MPDILGNEMLARFFWAAAVIAAGLILFGLANRLVLTRASSKVRNLAAFQPGKPALVYFTTPTCAPCKTVQRPAIRRLQDVLGERLQVVEIDAAGDPHTAQEWGVMSVPTTFLIDANGRPRHINHGVTTAEKLMQQLSEIF
jgi:thioredoxin 1